MRLEWLDVAPGKEAVDMGDLAGESGSEAARSKGLSFYDGCYLALAEREDCLLWTADGALLEKAPKSTVSTGTLLWAFAKE